MGALLHHKWVIQTRPSEKWTVDSRQKNLDRVTMALVLIYSLR